MEIRPPIIISTNSCNADRSEIDTLVVPALEEGFHQVFLGENRWWPVLRISQAIASQLKYIAVYRAAPISAITHYAQIHSITPLGDNAGKFVIDFSGPAKPIGPIRLIKGGAVRAVQGRRYAQLSKLLKARNLDEAF